MRLFLTETEEFFRDFFEDFDFFLAVVVDVRKADVEDAERHAFAGEVDADLAAGGSVAADVIGALGHVKDGDGLFLVETLADDPFAESNLLLGRRALERAKDQTVGLVRYKPTHESLPRL